MKYVNLINEEGALNLVSDNDIISINIIEIHPELTFEDNSMLIFPNVDSYYKLIGNAELCTPIDQDVDMEKLLEGLKDSDTVTGFSYGGEDVASVLAIDYEDLPTLYYLQRTGLNPISNNEV